ncbi:CHASE domain-containing protein [Pontibacter sp. 172403-2]|uniref:CHASE domain-containing protein n=1 Tax=Pontibacter rufus TaxID=2791028 RepID=UPI0018B00243|nr:CHASE domain-containing protein [Pontibacter sp. 172403-2]MBF9253068.1 CHASE domain-containing protein [Pontibacter sp. 172403-2]
MNFAKPAAFTKDYFIAISSFLLIFLLTLFIYDETKKKAEERGAKLFEIRASQASESIQTRVKDYIQILIGAKALFIASDTVTRSDWHTYYETLHLEENYPGIQGFGYTHIIYPDELARFEQQIRNEGFPDFKVYPEGKRNIYSSIIYLEPFGSRNRRAFGYDMFSEPVRQSAMRIARDTKQPAMSGKVRLVQENGKNEQPGFLIYLPIYKDNADPKSMQDRQRLIKGFVYSPFRVHDLMNSVLGDDYQDLDIEIFDGNTLSRESLLYNTDSTFHFNKHGGSKFHNRSTLSIGNHTWRIFITGKESFVRTADADLPYFILWGGSIISFLMFFIIWSLSNTRRSNRLKQTITDNATAGLFIMNANGYCTFMNPAAEEMTGFTFKEMQARPLHQMIHHHRPDGTPYPLEECPIDRALPTNNSMRAHEDMFIRKDGTFFNVTCATRPIIENGVPAYTIIEVRDITDEKRAQQAIIESEARFRTMADNAPVMIWVGDASGKCVYVNKQWTNFTGQTFAQSISMGWRQVVVKEEEAAYAETFRKAAEHAEAFKMEMRMRRHDGEIRWAINTAMPRFGVNGEFLGHIGSIIDITEIKEAERKVKQNAELLQKLFLEVPALVGLVRAPDYQYALASPLYRQLYGNRPLVGKTIFEAHSPSEGEGFFSKLEHVFKTGEPFVGKEVPTTIDCLNSGGRRDAYFNLVYQPLLDTSGEVEAVLVFAVEVTELVAARKRMLEANDELSEKNSELQRINNDLDSFVYTASHDLKSPIANMEGLTALLRDVLDGKLNQADNKILDMVSDSINKLKQTIADLTEITKVQKDLQAEVEPIYFEKVLQDITSDIQRLVLESDATITTNFQVDSILYTRKNLRSIIYNLVSNGIKYKALERRPEVNISTYRQGEFVVLEVADNGLGIKKEQQHKLFSMFRRLHTHVEGTGIGLYIVKRIIENNGGRIEVESELGQGTTFKVYFRQEPEPVQV